MSENCKTCKYHIAVDDGFMCDCEESENYWDWTSFDDSCPYHEKKESKNMLEGLREALGYVVELGNNAVKTELVEIAGKTYARSGGGKLERYDEADYAKPVTASTLTALSDYIENCHEEFRGRKMIIHVESPTAVRLVSVLDADRRRETLFRAEAIVSEFRFDRWYDQEGFMLGLQANFQPTADLNLILKVSGNIEKKNNAAYSDDGVSQVVTMQTGVATKADALVPNPARLKPFRTFQEVPQPESNFVFRIGDDEEPTFKLVEAEGGIWRNEAIQNIKDYLATLLADMPKGIQDMITIIG